MGGFFLLLELHLEGSALLPVQQACSLCSTTTTVGKIKVIMVSLVFPLNVEYNFRFLCLYCEEINDSYILTSLL